MRWCEFESEKLIREVGRGVGLELCENGGSGRGVSIGNRLSTPDGGLVSRYRALEFHVKSRPGTRE